MSVPVFVDADDAIKMRPVGIAKRSLEKVLVISDDELDKLDTPPAKRPCIVSIDDALENATDESVVKEKPVTAPIKWNEEQNLALTAITVEDRRTWITGGGGAGKTALLKEIIERLNAKHGSHRVFVCATTGVAAIPISGMTLHSFAGVGLANEPVDVLIAKINKNRKARWRWMNAAVIIVDEASMLRSDFFEKCEEIGRVMRKKPHESEQVFGGIQIVLSGDFFQLPPVVLDSEGPEAKKNRYIFQSPIWNKVIECMVGLTTIYRQTDAEFVSLLNHFRVGALTDDHIAKLRTRILPVDASSSTHLYPRKSAVSAHNTSQLAAIKSKGTTFVAVDWSTDDYEGEKALKTLQDHCAAEELVTLKVGALVLLLQNLALDFGLVNGSRGVVREIYENYGFDENGELIDGMDYVPNNLRNGDKPQKNEYVFDQFARIGSMAVKVAFDNGLVAIISPQSWKIEQKSQVPNASPRLIAERKQIPFTLAWAISIHKSQGMTLSSACVSLCNLFEPGQGYVACSRLTTLEGLTILSDFDPSLLVADQTVVDFYTKNGLLAELV